MKATPVKFWHSIVSRFALFFTGLLVFAIMLSGYLVFRKTSTVMIDYAQEQIKHSAELAEQSFYALLEEVSNDVAVITSSLALQNYLKTPGAISENDLNQLFSIILKNKPTYFQIRLIQDNGQEVIRFDKTPGGVVQTPVSSLQQKGNLEYFQEAMKIGEGDTYFSRINLNEEYGIISNPLTVTLRAASPVFTSADEKFGIVIININLQRYYDVLDRISRSGAAFFLLDERGQYLYATEHEKEFGLQLGTAYTFEKDFGTSIDSIGRSSGKFGEYYDANNNLYLHFIKKLTYFQGHHDVYLISSIAKDMLLQTARDVRADSFQTLLLVCLVSIFFSYLFTRLFSKQISLVTQAISSYDHGEAQHFSLPENRKDEIGVLARSFSKMRLKIDQHLHDLNDALKKEKEAKKQRDEFLQNMSHELRTPLNAIQGLSQLLQKNAPNQAQLPIIYSMERSVQNLSGLVYDVLDHQKLVEGKLNIQYQTTNIAKLLDDIYSSYQFEAVKKGLAFKKEISKSLHNSEFKTDSLRLSQIVINLVVNAIKYTDKGGVILKADVTTDEPAILEITVVDSGFGILPENLNRINDRFFREREELSGRYGGYGLGLSIVKQLIVLFGGTLFANSEKDKGSIFQIRIPVVPVFSEQNDPISSIRQKRLPKLSKSYCILQMDDDASTLDLFRYTLTSEHIRLTQVSQISEGDAQIELNKPDLIISDLMFGERNFSTILHDWIHSARINCPVLIVSALEPSMMQWISPYWFQKPFDISILCDRVYQLLGRREYEIPNFNIIYTNYDNDIRQINRVLGIMEEEFETYLSRIEAARQSFDPDAWQAIAHKLIAHTKSLQLQEITGLLKINGWSPSIDSIEKITNTLIYCLCCIRSEIWINSTD